MATTSALIAVPVDLKPNPLPYGRLPLQAGAWDQMWARHAYQNGGEPPQMASGAVDKRV